MSTGGGSSEKEDSESEEGCGSPRLPRRHRSRPHPQHIYSDTLPEVCYNVLTYYYFIHSTLDI